jgi:hypothetical protein
MDVSKAWKTTGDNIKISAKESLGYYELKKHKPLFDERCSKLLDKRKQVKWQWSQDDKVIVTCSYVLKDFSKSNYQSKPRL